MKVLAPYQKAGVEWLKANDGCCLADEMGLGKTVQAVSSIPEWSNRVVIVCPAGAVPVWQAHLEDWRPDLPPTITVTSGLRSVPERAVMLGSYDTLRLGVVAGTLAGWKPEVLICDEAHYLKNPVAKRTKAVMRIAARTPKVWLLTGTPIPNNVSELYSLLCVSDPSRVLDARTGSPMSYSRWMEKFCDTVETAYGTKIVGTKNRIALKERIDGWMLRRRTKDVLTDLPKMRLREYPLIVDIDAMSQEQHRELRMLAERVNLPQFADMMSKGIIPDDETYGRMRHLLGILKAEAVSPMVEELLTEHEKIVLFGWHTHAVDRMFEKSAGYEPAKIVGATPTDLRRREVERFQEDPACRVFVGQIKAAGTAITLTAGSCVRIVEPSTVPGDNLQAIFRIYRMGQKAQSVDAGLVYAVHPKLGKVDRAVSQIIATKVADLAKMLD